MAATHQSVVESQFGPQAGAYVESAVHASGRDLDWIEERCAAERPARALDLGCGGGHVSYRIAPHAGTVTACDLSQDMLSAVAATAEARGLANVRTERARAEALPFADASFDLVVSRFSAHHWVGFEQGLREARRVLRPGGRALFVDAASPGAPLLDTHLQAVEVLRDPSHVRDYTPSEWSAALTRAGLRPVSTATDRLRLDFATWIERMRTPPPAVTAIRYLQDALAGEARRHFAIEPDGSFMLDTLWIEAA